MKLTISELETLLRGVRGATFVGLVARTVPAMRKKGNPYWGAVEKVQHVQGVIGFRYGSCVNRQRRRERGSKHRVRQGGGFQPLPRSWGQKVAGTPLVEYAPSEDDQRAYLEIKIERISRIEYQWADSGDVIGADLLAPWLQHSRPSRRQRLTRPVVVRDFRLDHIAELRMRGAVYWVDRPRPPQRRAA